MKIYAIRVDKTTTQYHKTPFELSDPSKHIICLRYARKHDIAPSGVDMVRVQKQNDLWHGGK